ncbi:hypothetical protein F2Q70_00032683 [Brassica cretica]|uniref:Uncharacterized protein n=1 Tax=Brassica cretica TaxID=69181 RepID=A0A8S9HC99_BRACR|nr:hypothetical protein F2Q70_00032683 [Brassica cretica]KAF2553822.1 hypothetical protein F2Q68_00037049 [Brassica cretica]
MSVGFVSHGVGRTLCFSLFPFSRLYSFWLWRRTSDGGRPTLSSGGGGLFNTVYRQLLSLAPLGYDSEEGRDGCGFKVASGGLGGFG